MSNVPTLDLTGRRILVTGAAGGIGLETARILIAAGAKVVLNDISDESLAAASKEVDAAGALTGNVADEESVKSLIKETLGILGGLDGVVNNAGVFEPIKGTKRQSLDDWRRVIDVNLQSVFLMSREAAHHMQPGSSFVNMASVAGLGGFGASNGYGVSKAGIIMMTKTMACDFARYGIRVNAVAPGVIQAPMAEAIFDKASMGSDIFTRRIPMGRLGKPGEIGNAVLFLLSDLASYITGVTLPVDGGWTAFGGAGDASVGNDAS